MKNLSSLSKSLFFLIAACAVLAGTAFSGVYLEGIGAAFVLILASLFFIRKTGIALKKIADVSDKATRGDFDARIVKLSERGSLEKLADSVNNLIDITDAFVRETRHSMEIVSEGHYYRKVIEKGLPGYFRLSAAALNRVTASTESKVAAFHDYADRFEANAKAIVNKVAGASNHLQMSSRSMQESAEATSLQVEEASQASSRSSGNVQTVASAAEELTASITEISQRVSQASNVASAAEMEASKTNQSIQELADVAQKVGEVVDLINDIASQTNLLALNATIEAARAGEAGKGFAVVATEVKNLASQTAKATEDISKQIASIQAETQKAVQAIREISGTIKQVSEISTSIASAVEEQRAATQEIARNVQEAASSTSEVTHNMQSVLFASGESKKASGEVLDAAVDLSSEAKILQGEVDKFLTEVRSV